VKAAASNEVILCNTFL